MNLQLKKDIEEVHRMVEYLDKFQQDANDERLPIYVQQAASAAICELKRSIAIKIRDIRRRMREKNDY